MAISKPPTTGCPADRGRRREFARRPVPHDNQEMYGISGRPVASRRDASPWAPARKDMLMGAEGSPVRTATHRGHRP
ncbi:hypothetical protein GCM10010378_49470 [Streptomyces viridochromogenes]